MPVRGRDKVDEESRQSWFSHQSEEARPYYYSVYLADHDIKAEIAPTERAAIMRFTFPESDESGVVIDAFDRGSYIRVMHDKRTVVGYTTRNSGGVPDNFKNWFIVRFDRKIRDFQIYDGTKPVEGEQLVGEHALVRVGFEPARRAGNGARSLVVHIADAGRAEPRRAGKGRFRNREGQGASTLGRGARTY